MRVSIVKALLACAAIAAPGIACAQDAPTAAPSFWDLESSYPRDARLDKAQIAAEMDKPRAMLSASVPAGTPVTIAEARLRAAGATCRADRHATGLVKCLYHQYDLSDGAADDIRWTVALHVAASDVAGLSVDRYVDRHGSD